MKELTQHCKSWSYYHSAHEGTNAAFSRFTHESSSFDVGNEAFCTPHLNSQLLMLLSSPDVVNAAFCTPRLRNQLL